MEVHEYGVGDFEHIILASRYTVRAEYLTRIGNKRVSVSVVEAPTALHAERLIVQQLRADELVPIRVTASIASD